MPDCALYGTQIAFVCPKCGAPLDAQLGLDGTTETHARELLQSTTACQIWRQLARIERYMITSMKTKKLGSRAHRKIKILKHLANLLLHSSHISLREFQLRPIDYFSNAYVNAPRKLGLATRHLYEPFPATHLTERRKALLLLFGLLDGGLEQYGFGKQHAPISPLREYMMPSSYQTFERLIFDLARLSLPK
ncbi:hypothetical protein [Roseovarius sp. EL26]|uniref:hypothetical protein n=1 Tax=Roseovarius sp. EL26 TaxID=2126672 RepID=UPI0020B10638|nr:hypothetical protein [Roseovarius sp. EL26]